MTDTSAGPLSRFFVPADDSFSMPGPSTSAAPPPEIYTGGVDVSLYQNDSQDKQSEAETPEKPEKGARDIFSRMKTGFVRRASTKHKSESKNLFQIV